MTSERLVPYAGLSFVVVAALTLFTLVARSPDTHGNLWGSVPADYARTSFDTIREADLPAILADLPPFAFPAPRGAGHAGMAAGEAEGGDRPAPDRASAASGGSGEDAVQKVTLTEGEFAISPDRVTVKLGVPVELTVVNEGKQVHGIWLPDFGISEDIRGGRTQVFRFTPEQPGRYRYTCNYSLCGTKEEHGRMVGFLLVQ